MPVVKPSPWVKHKSYRVRSTLDDSKRAKKAKTERSRVVRKLKQLRKDKKKAYFKPKPNILAIYVANVDNDDNNKENTKNTKGKKVGIKPDCSKLTDGITEDLDDDTVSKIYDDLLLQLGFGDGQCPLTTTDSTKDIPDYQNPFKCGYLKAKPSKMQRCKSRLGRMFRTARNVLARPFAVCRNNKVLHEE